MGDGPQKKGASGTYSQFKAPKYEKRHIVVAEGIQFHDVEIGKKSIMGHLKSKFGKEFTVRKKGKEGLYFSKAQQVEYHLKVVHKKREFIKALETKGIIVIYAGHSRYGRGACFDQYTGAFPVKGEQWENGNDKEDGLFRMGYPFVPVPLHDIEKHGYKFAPVPVVTQSKKEQPASVKNHPHNLEEAFRHRRLRIFKLPKQLHAMVLPKYASKTNQYYGFYQRENKKPVKYFILHAGWIKTQNPTHELGAVNIQCRTFCHFGCSSKDHFWHVLRHPNYRGWQRAKPPTERFAYFTTAPGILWHHWTYYLLKYSKRNDPANSGEHWWKSHQYAKYATKRRLYAIPKYRRLKFRVY